MLLYFHTESNDFGPSGLELCKGELVGDITGFVKETMKLGLTFFLPGEQTGRAGICLFAMKRDKTIKTTYWLLWNMPGLGGKERLSFQLKPCDQVDLQCLTRLSCADYFQPSVDIFWEAKIAKCEFSRERRLLLQIHNLQDLVGDSITLERLSYFEEDEDEPGGQVWVYETVYFVDGSHLLLFPYGSPMQAAMAAQFLGRMAIDGIQAPSPDDHWHDHYGTA